jgi:membrane protein implicated in regulation of membrane protease activity
MESLELTWWIWIAVGIIFLALELLNPGTFFLFFFGIGAIVVGLLTLIGISGPVWVQIVLFAALSLVSLVTLRGLLISRWSSNDASDHVDQLVGEIAVATQDIAVDATGQVELRGSVWNGRNIGKLPILSSDRSTVTRVDNLTLLVSRVQ